MQIVHSDKVKSVPPSPEVEALLKTISEAQLREWVEHLAVPRHYVAEPEQNRAIGDWLFRRKKRHLTEGNEGREGGKSLNHGRHGLHGRGTEGLNIQ